jgi:hypothetical protein
MFLLRLSNVMIDSSYNLRLASAAARSAVRCMPLLGAAHRS